MLWLLLIACSYICRRSLEVCTLSCNRKGKVVKGADRMQDPRWRVLSEPAKDLILKLLQPDPKNRYTAKQALNHRWIKGAREDSILDLSLIHI